MSTPASLHVAQLSHCRACGAAFECSQWSLEMAPIPLVGKLFRNRDMALSQPVIDLTWISCGECGLLQVLQDVADADIYSVYNYSSGSFKGLQGHFGELAQIHNAELEQRTDPVFVEIGCNDGILIKSITDKAQKFGVDPSDIAAKSVDGTYTLINTFFSDDMEDRFPSEFADIVSTSNSFAHFTDIAGAIREIARILKPDGILTVEVHDGNLLIKDMQWDTIYHEHKVEWTVRAAQNCFGALGLTLEEVTELPMHGGTIRLRFRKTEFASTSGVSAQAADLDAFRAGFEARYNNQAYKALQEVESFCCYGCSGRAINWLYQLGLEDKVTCIYDDSPERVGRYLGHSGIEVRDGDRVGEYDELVVITAWNFASVIREKHRTKHVRWIQYYE